MCAKKAKLLVIAGATASGKSSLAMSLAQRLPADIISGDSMQFYRSLDIGVAKPTTEEQQLVKHHLIDIMDISERVDVFRYLELANQAISEVTKQGKIPMVVGGTGMYLKALLYGLDELPGDVQLRAELDQLYDSDAGFEPLKVRMATEDPIALEKWGQHRRKLIRALEVKLLCGKSIIELQQGERELKWDAKVLMINPEREILKERIALRTKQMLAEGWIEEAEQAIQAGLLTSPTAHQALGYKIINQFLLGEINRQELEEQIVTKTWQFARRQLTWFRNQHPEAQWLSWPVAVEDTFNNIQNWSEL